MKKITTLALTVITIALVFTACSNTAPTSSSSSQKSTSARHHSDQTGGSQGGGDVSTRGSRGPM